MANEGSLPPLPASALPTEPCKICNTSSALIGALDFNRSCAEVFGTVKEKISILNFGGGEGQMVRNLKQANFTDISWYNPFSDKNDPLPNGPYDLISCIEVMEHTTDPKVIVQTVTNLVNENGAVFFFNPHSAKNILLDRLDWWYIRPRNGHVSIYTNKSLQHLWSVHGLDLYHPNEGIHIAIRGNPKFLKINNSGKLT
jgi:2-polyprenyl-6-hydroxyphenyl methylase/3-demethylubiquinone-9 3-methyltransferase